MAFYFLAIMCLIGAVFCAMKYRKSHDRYSDATDHGIPEVLGLFPKREGPKPSPLPSILWFVLAWIFVFAMIIFVVVAQES